MKLDDLVSGLSSKSTDELLDLLHLIRKDRTERKPAPAQKRVQKTTESKIMAELADLNANDVAKLLKLLGEA